ncbi:ADP-ribosylglycohydrolase [Paraconexibacter sp. AEG42_29]|uniref:ADP-ribosylglycohydrolase n=1 Tax=Paraconexibacter sp. AEG42_29 TaxID=2997339 RepID=A0AAU7B1T1_9ACTN
MSTDDQTRNRFRGALLGLAAGDAVGTTVEFKPRGTFPPVTDMVGGGPFSLPVGAWTDDTSMALCLAESLVECQGFDPVDQLQRYVRWYREGYWSSTGSCFDIGNATRAALTRFERTGEPFPGDADTDAAGNGPLMKLAPVALAYARHPAAAVARAGESARTTHGAPQAIDASRYFAGLLVKALNGAPVGELLHSGTVEPSPGIWTSHPLDAEVATVAAASFLTKEPPAIKGTGYVVDALEAALWALRSTDTFEAGVLAAVNLGDDADTTAAIYGQLAGAIHGADGIPQQWLDKLVMRDEITALADALFELSQTISLDGPAVSTAPLPGDSFWAIEGSVLAGPYPGAPTRAEAEAKLDAFLAAGVTCFLDLTEAGEGPPLQPYDDLLAKIATERGTSARHVRMAIPDVSVTTPAHMRTILDTIGMAVAEGETVYVHCWGGIGRTGTVLGCLLRERGMGAEETLAHLRALRAGTHRANRPSPETPDQREFVETWSA